MIKVTGIKSTMKQLERRVDREADRSVKREVRKLKANLIAATPIDTGEARQGWRLVKKLGKGFSLINDVEHIAALNNGSSQQAPARFIEKTILNMRGFRPHGIIVRTK